MTLQPKDLATHPSRKDTPSNIISSIELIISHASFKKIQEEKILEVAIDTGANSAIAKVDYLLDGKVVARSIESPFIVTISLAQLIAGEHTIQAIAYDIKGGSVKSKVFTFTIASGEVTPSDEESGDLLGSLPRKTPKAVTASTNGSQNSGRDSGGGGNPVDPGTPEEGTRTAGGWWASLPSSMQICGSDVLDGGPTSAPAGSITVPAGNNSGFNFNQANKTFWFAPGVHTLGAGEFSAITPGSGSTYVGAPGAVLDGLNNNSYAFQGNASNVTIRYLEIRNFGVGGLDNMNEGVINHDSGTGWTMEYLYAHNNDGAAVFIGTGNTVRYSCLENNGQYGFSMFKPPVQGDAAIKNIVLDHNEIAGNNQDDWENQPGHDGCGCTGGGKFWDVKGATITNNYVHDNLSTGLWADTNDIDFLFDSNWIEHNDGQAIWYEISYNATISRNVMKRNAWGSGVRNTGSPAPAIYISESGGDSRLQSTVTGSTDLQIKNNMFEDNFSGVSIYENSNRFCNSHGNTSTGYCTPFVLPTSFDPLPSSSSYPDPVNNTHPCYTKVTKISHTPEEPYITDCRWHSKNVKVFNNEFRFNKDNVPCTGGYCGVQALIATGDDNISWAPDNYKIVNVQANVMHNNNNQFYNNAYIGQWRFARGYGNRVPFSIWQSNAYGQDASSTYSADPITNYVDNNSSTIEASIGNWQDAYNTTLTRSTLEAHGGTHSLQVAMSDGFWSAQLGSSLEVDAGAKTISFWVKRGTGTPTLVAASVRWLDEFSVPIKDGSNNPITTVMPPLTPSSSWQQTSVSAVAPPKTAYAVIVLHNESGSPGSTFFADDFIIADGP